MGAAAVLETALRFSDVPLVPPYCPRSCSKRYDGTFGRQTSLSAPREMAREGEGGKRRRVARWAGRQPERHRCAASGRSSISRRRMRRGGDRLPDTARVQDRGLRCGIYRARRQRTARSRRGPVRSRMRPRPAARRRRQHASRGTACAARVNETGARGEPP